MDQLDLGVARGIITAAQRDALRALSEEASAPRVEAPRALNAVTIAYWVGGIAVLAAFGWFLVSRWAVLGPAGVLVVALVYGGLFALMARVFYSHGFVQAAAVATLLVVGMTPLVAWALLSLSGYWDLVPETGRPMYYQLYEPAWKQLRWIPVDLAVILVALIALRRVQFGVLALPIAMALAALGAHTVFLVIEPDVAQALAGRLPLVLAVVMLTIAYALDVRTSGAEDYAIWFYLVAFGPLIVAAAQFWGESAGWTAHVVLVGSAVFAYAALRLGRRLLLFAAFVGFVSYLGYLAFDVFKHTLEFPVALATLGIVVILSAVFLQRRYPSLVRATSALPRNIPGAPLALGGALVIALTLIVIGIPDAREKIALRYWREGFERRRMHNIQKWGDKARLRPPRQAPLQ